MKEIQDMEDIGLILTAEIDMHGHMQVTKEMISLDPITTAEKRKKTQKKKSAASFYHRFIRMPKVNEPIIIYLRWSGHEYYLSGCFNGNNVVYVHKTGTWTLTKDQYESARWAYLYPPEDM